MKKGILLLLSVIALSVYLVACSKDDKPKTTCPDGYYGAGCQTPWNVAVTGVWNNAIVTVPATSNPKTFVIKNGFESNGVYGDVNATMTDSVSFTLERAVLGNDTLLYGNGKLSASGLQITGTEVQQRSHPITYPPYYETEIDTVSFTWNK